MLRRAHSSPWATFIFKAESVQANDSKESGSDASAKDGSKSKEKSHTHDWSITYKTVHHDAVTHTEHVAPVYQNLTTPQ